MQPVFSILCRKVLLVRFRCISDDLYNFSIPKLTSITFRITCFAAVLLLCCSPPKITLQHSLPDGKDITLDSEEFNRRIALAEELVQDDQIAWITSDSLSAKDTLLLDSMDQTWFVILDNKDRYVFYGRFDTATDQYLPKYAFSAHNDAVPEQMSLAVTEPVHEYARAVATGVAHLKTVLDSLGFDVSYNHYIRRNSDSSFTMWFFPAGYNKYCAQGLDIRVIVRANGRSIEKSTILGQFIRYFELNKPEQVVKLENPFDSFPSVGNLFFALNNRQHFDMVSIICTNATYTTFFDNSEERWIWKLSADSIGSGNDK